MTNKNFRKVICMGSDMFLFVNMNPHVARLLHKSPHLYIDTLIINCYLKHEWKTYKINKRYINQ